jgi:hypothetical protein
MMSRTLAIDHRAGTIVGNIGLRCSSYRAVENLRSFLPAAALASALVFPCLAHAGSDDMLMPISVGGIGNRDLQASTIGFGVGPREDRLHFLFHGRAMVSPRLSAGTGGVKGGFAFVDKPHVHFGVEFGVSAGGGRIDRHSAGLLAAVEPGLFVRLLSDKAGAFHIDGGWYQPLLIRRDGVRGAAMISLGWSPFYGR